MRILPSYYLVLPVWCVVNAVLEYISPSSVAGNVLLCGWWFGVDRQLGWFSQAICAFYLMAPLLFRVADRQTRRWPWLCAVTAAFLLLGLTQSNTQFLLATARLPVFLLGMLLGRAAWEKRRVPGWVQAGLVALSALTLLVPKWLGESAQNVLLWKYGLWWYPFFFVAPGATIALTYAGELLRAVRLRPVVGAVEYVGGCTFEIYLAQELLFFCSAHFLDERNLSALVTILASVAVGILVRLLSRPLGRAVARCAQKSA